MYLECTCNIPIEPNGRKFSVNCADTGSLCSISRNSQSLQLLSLPLIRVPQNMMIQSIHYSIAGNRGCRSNSPARPCPGYNRQTVARPHPVTSGRAPSNFASVQFNQFQLAKSRFPPSRTKAVALSPMKFDPIFSSTAAVTAWVPHSSQPPQGSKLISICSELEKLSQPRSQSNCSAAHIVLWKCSS